MFFPASTSLIHTDSPFIAKRNNPNIVWSTALTNNTSLKCSFLYFTIVLRINNIKADKKDNPTPTNLAFQFFSFSASVTSLDFSSNCFFSKKKLSYDVNVTLSIDIIIKHLFIVFYQFVLFVLIKLAVAVDVAVGVVNVVLNLIEYGLNTKRTESK